MAKDELGFEQGWGVVETDNFGRDYPDEKFVAHLPFIRTKEQAEAIAKAINACTHENYDRWWKAVELPYKLQPGFEP